MAYLRPVDMPFFLYLLFTTATWFWLLGAILLGIGYAALLYNKKSKLPKNQLRAVFTLRALAVAGMVFLLFAPLIKIANKRLEKPIILIAQDNSASIKISKPENFNPSAYSKNLKALKEKLQRDFEVKTFRFGTQVNPGLHFDSKDNLTNISAFFKQVNDQYANRNIGAVILASDGLYNQGGDPQYEAAKIKAPIYTIALGDTVPKKDILISDIRYNDIVFLGNQFQIEVEIDAYLSKGAESRISVADKSGIKTSKPFRIISNDYHVTIPLTLNANAKGIQRFTVSLTPIAGELSSENNSKTIFVEVIDDRQKITIVANSPHPDIAALKQSIEENKNYEVKVVMADLVKANDIAQADLVILHQLPSTNNSAQDILRQASKKPTWFILGIQSSLPVFSFSQNVLSIADNGRIQEAFGTVKNDFYAFTLSEESKIRTLHFAPLFVPFSNYTLKDQAAVLLSQRIGKIETNKPLLLFSTGHSRRVGILTGEGLWRWKLNEFEENGNSLAVDELINKTIQYLSSKEDKRKFRVYTYKTTFEENEQVVFNAELYNDAYELVNAPDVNMLLKNKAGKSYSFLFSRTGNSYELNAGILPVGDYTFSASTILGQRKYSFSGQFNIMKQQSEFLQTTANHQLLFSLSNQSGGEMISPDGIEKLEGLIKKNELVKTVSYEDKQYEEPINLKGIFFFLLALLASEWFFRKRNGEI